MIHSIRARVAFLTTIGVVLVAGGAGLVWYSSAARILRSELDDELDTRVRTLATLTRVEGSGFELEFSDELMPGFLPGEDPSYFSVWREDGTLVEGSRSLATRPLPFPTLTPGTMLHRDLELPDGRPGRAAALSFLVTEGIEEGPEETPAPTTTASIAPVAVVLVAKSREALDQRLAALAWSFALVGGGLVGGLALAVTLLVGWGLRPLQELSREVGRLDPRSTPGTLHRRGLPTELVPIASRVDDLLARMHGALDRERRVASHLAHELRTPISELKSLTEVALRWPGSGDHLQRSLASAHTIAGRMQALSEAVLRFSHPEHTRIAVQVESLDLAAVVRELVAGGRRSEVPIQALLPASLAVRSDPAALRILLGNLIENAREHATSGPISCELGADDSGVEFRIRNPASNLSPADLGRLGERFWRGDPARTADGASHFGLGLALALELCEALEARLSFRLEAGQLEARLHLPAPGPG